MLPLCCGGGPMSGILNGAVKFIFYRAIHLMVHHMMDKLFPCHSPLPGASEECGVSGGGEVQDER